MSHWILIPIFNEAASIGRVVADARSHGPVMVINDGSTDGGGAVARSAGATVISHNRRRGKGAALRTGVDVALEQGATQVVTLDGDGQHDPDEIPLLLATAREEPRAIVIGGRLGSQEVIPAGRINAMRVAGFFINWLTARYIRDTQSGFRLYPISLFAETTLRQGGFVLETEVLLAGRRLGYEILEIPITAIHHTGRRSRFHPFRDGVAIGIYLTGQVMGRIGRDGGRIVRRLAAPFSRERVRQRHLDLARETVPYRDLPAPWGIAAGAFALRRSAHAVQAWWSDRQIKEFRMVSIAALVFPLLALLLLIQPLLSLASIDLLTPFVLRVYSQERLAGVGNHFSIESGVGAELPT